MFSIEFNAFSSFFYFSPPLWRFIVFRNRFFCFSFLKDFVNALSFHRFVLMRTHKSNSIILVLWVLVWWCHLIETKMWKKKQEKKWNSCQWNTFSCDLNGAFDSFFRAIVCVARTQYSTFTLIHCVHHSIVANHYFIVLIQKVKSFCVIDADWLDASSQLNIHWVISLQAAISLISIITTFRCLSEARNEYL